MKAPVCRPRRLATRSRSAAVAVALLVLLVQTLLVWNFSSLDGSSGRRGGGNGNINGNGNGNGNGYGNGDGGGRHKRAVGPDKADGRTPGNGAHGRSEAAPPETLGNAATRHKLRRTDVYRSHRPKEKPPPPDGNNENSVPRDSFGADGGGPGDPAARRLPEPEGRPAAAPAPCEMLGKEVISALSRAKSRQCRQRMADVYCKHREEKLMPRRLPRYCPLPGKASASVEWDEERDPQRDPQRDRAPASPVSPVRLAFVLVVHGRAARQFRRLFKAIYHTAHFYYIHVDERSDFLHREVAPMARRYPNVRVTPWRMATIWGGASLLAMYLRAMEDLLAMSDWSWDFFVNLSGADYPIRTNDELVAFLSKHRHLNFIKSHGRDNARFIRKQGLDRLFVECDTHMWRLGDRQIPEGIQVDGGSDWFLLNRAFVDYVARSQDELVTGLKRFYAFTLLPAESFFHTVLENSALCGSMVDNNLRLTNWNRKLGCKCQYKHIVDWCGCSPNDFKPADVPRFEQASRPAFFARKFEAAVSQEVVNLLDARLFGAPAPGLPGLHAYWENVYERETDDKPTDGALGHYHAFARMGLERAAASSSAPGSPALETCRYQGAAQPLSVYMYFLSDRFQGYLVRHAATEPGSGRSEILETWVTPRDHFALAEPPHPDNRLLHIQVGREWDPKERLFITRGGLLGPEDAPSAVLRWRRGSGNLTATVVWIDPTNVIATTYDVRVDAGAEVTHYRPPLAGPLRPGVWTLKVLDRWSPLGQTSFPVAPLQFRRGRPLSPEEASTLHGGPPGKSYMEQSFHGLNPILRLPLSLGAVEEAEANAGLTGAPLRRWLDRLLAGFWAAHDVCSVGGEAACPALRACRRSAWSSFGPDPKSQLGPPRRDGRIR
ncbi:xylosyltransferase 1-like [Stigmatopora argus]